MNGSPRGMRQRVAAEAARIIAESGLLDFAGARRKAVARLRITDRRQWPDNAEIASALESYRSLFQSGEREDLLQRLRRGAIRAMVLLADYDPRLVGPVRDGTAAEHTAVTLYLSVEIAKNVVIGLMDHDIFPDAGERRIRYSGHAAPEMRPALRFVVDDVDIEAVLVGDSGHSRPPLDPVSGKPERGLAIDDVRGLLAAQPRSEIGL